MDNNKNNVLNTENEALYRMRLSVETNVNAHTIFRDSEPIAYRLEKDELQKLVEACEDEAEYLEWKEAFLNRKLEEFRKKDLYLTCEHSFEGFGTYLRVLPEDQLEEFEKWVEKNPAVTMTGHWESTDEELREYIALNARAI